MNQGPVKFSVKRRKRTAIFLSFSLILCTSLSYAKSSSLTIVKKPQPFEAISIPEEYGKIEESFSGTSSKTIIYIQDVHDSLEAQENIARTIDFLVGHAGVKTVLEEGYEGRVPTDDYFGFIKDPVIKEKVSYFLMDRLRIGGAEYSHINRKKDFRLVGADNIKWYLENIEWYRRNAAHKKETENDLAALQKEIDRLANQYLPKELKDWIKIKHRFNEQKLSLLDYLKRLSPNKVQQYPTIAILLSAEKSKGEEILEKAKAIDVKALFQDLDHLENTYARQYLRNERDAEIFRYWQGLALLKRLNDIQMTPAEYEAIKEQLQNLNTRRLAEFIAQTTKKSIILSKRWEENIKNASRFYEIAEARDRAVEKYLDSFIGSAGENVSVLVFGGFHKDQLKELFKKKSLSYLIVSPKITALDQRHQNYYKQLMSGGHYSFEVPFYVRHAARSESRFVQTKIDSFAKQSFPHELDLIQKIVRQHSSAEIPILLPLIENELANKSRSEVRTKKSKLRQGPAFAFPEKFAGDLIAKAQAIMNHTEQIKEFLKIREIRSTRVEIAQEEDSSGGHVLRFILDSENGAKSFYAKLRHSDDNKRDLRKKVVDKWSWNKEPIIVTQEDQDGDWIKYRVRNQYESHIFTEYRGNPTTLEYQMSLEASHAGILPPAIIIEDNLILLGLDDAVSLHDLPYSPEWMDLFLLNQEYFVKTIGKTYARLNKEFGIRQADIKEEHIFLTKKGGVFLIDLSTRGEEGSLASRIKTHFVDDLDLRGLRTTIRVWAHPFLTFEKAMSARGSYDWSKTQDLFGDWITEGYQGTKEIPEFKALPAETGRSEVRSKNSIPKWLKSPKTFDLKNYEPKPVSPKHIIVHAGEMFDNELFAKTAIERLVKMSGPGNSFEIMGVGGWRNARRVPASYLHHNEFVYEGTESDLKKLDDFLSNPEEFILSGGYCESCHLAWFNEILGKKVRAGERIIFHLPVDAIYPQKSDLTSRDFTVTKYHETLNRPIGNGLLGDLNVVFKKPWYKRVQHRNLSAAVFKNGKLDWKNSDQPQVIINIWDTMPDWYNPASVRSEVRKANERLQSTLNETIHLQRDVVFTIRPETLERLARAKKAEGHDQWLELLGLKMLNEDKLHIVIDSKEEQVLSGRTSELLMNHKKIYLGWGPRTLASLPKNVPVIRFEKLINGQISGDLFKGPAPRQISVTFDIFDGAFLAALRYAQNPSRLEELARQNRKMMTSATALSLGLLDQLFKTYVIVSQAA